jgi:hypothetical protein
MTSRIKFSSTTIKLRIILLFILCGILSVSKVSAQEAKEDQYPFDQKEEQTPAFKERLFYGGSLGLMFGTITDIQISPVVGYWILPRIAVAVGPSYRYYKNYYDRTALYGGKAYLEFVIVQDLNSFIPMGSHTGIFFHVENELLSLKTSFWKDPPYQADRFYVNTVLAGGGLSQQIGKRASMNFMILWPVNDSGYEIYSKPEIRVTFTF